MAKSTISMTLFQSYVIHNQRVTCEPQDSGLVKELHSTFEGPVGCDVLSISWTSYEKMMTYHWNKWFTMAHDLTTEVKVISYNMKVDTVSKAIVNYQHIYIHLTWMVDHRNVDGVWLVYRHEANISERTHSHNQRCATPPSRNKIKGPDNPTCVALCVRKTGV